MIIQFKKTRVVVFAFFFLSVGAEFFDLRISLAGEIASPKGIPTVSIVPSTIDVDPDTAGSFQVQISSGEAAIGAYDIKITWTPGVFTVDSVGAGSSTQFGPPIANTNNEAGTLDLADFQASSLSQPSGTFTVATINYTAGGSGSTEIQLIVEELSDTNIVVLDPTAQGGMFTIIGGAPTATPTPSATPMSPTPTATFDPSAIPTAINPDLDLDANGKIGPQDLLELLTDLRNPAGQFSQEDLLRLGMDWLRPLQPN